MRPRHGNVVFRHRNRISNEPDGDWIVSRSRQPSYWTRPSPPRAPATRRHPCRPRCTAISRPPTSTRSRRMPSFDSTITVSTSRPGRISACGESRAEAFKRRVHRAAPFMLLDLHNHTRYSPDSRVDPAALVGVARKTRLAGVAITDHNSVGGIEIAEAAADPDFLVIPAIEVSTRSGHVLGYGIREVIPRDLSVSETAERIVALGGVPVAAHPFRFWSGLGPVAVAETTFPAYETCNGRTLRRGGPPARPRGPGREARARGGRGRPFFGEGGEGVTGVEAGGLGLGGGLQLVFQGRALAAGGR